MWIRQAIEAKTNETWDQIVEDRSKDIKVISGLIQDNLNKKILSIINISNHHEGSVRLAVQIFVWPRTANLNAVLNISGFHVLRVMRRTDSLILFLVIVTE